MKALIEEVLRSPRRLVMLLLLAMSAVYFYGASLQNHLVNTDVSQTDQLAYLRYAREFRESGYNYIMPRNRMPVYPLLQSLAYRPGMSEDEFFATGKAANVFLSLAILAVLFWLFQGAFPPLMTLNLMLITGFTVFMFKAPFFQAELLFYLLNLAAFLLMLRLFRNPDIKMGLITGLVFGIAHMTKASVLPGLLLFFVFKVVETTVAFLQKRPFPNILRQKIAPLFLLILFFLLSISVYVTNSKKIYGHYFYNVNSTFYLWYDSWNEARAGTIAAGDRDGWPDLPEEEIPSLRKYLEAHTSAQMLDRMRLGLIRVAANTILSYGYFIYFLIYSLLFVSICLLNWRICVEKFKTNYLLISFIVAYFVFYFLAVAWYTPIAKGNRFILAYFLPYMFVIFYVLRSTEQYFGPQASRLVDIVNVVVVLLLTGHIVYIMTNTIGSYYGGL